MKSLWFASQIYSAPLVSRSIQPFLREVTRESRQLREIDVSGQKWSRRNYPGGYTSYGSIDQLHRFSSTFMDLEKYLDRHVRKFASDLEWDLCGGRLAMTDCWLNIMPRGTAHSSHLHPNSVVSGTFYVVTPAGCSGLKFEDPRLPQLMAAPPRKSGAKSFQQPHITFPARAGHVLLFESWMRHEVAASPVSGERISISFNYDWVAKT